MFRIAASMTFVHILKIKTLFIKDVVREENLLRLEMYLFQEVEKPEMGFANHKFIQLWTGRVPVGHESFL